MRFLLTYGLDSVSATSENKLYQIKLVRESVRRLLKEMVEYSDQQLDTDSAKSSSNNQLTPQDKGRIGVPIKQGDWFCPECRFLNFARNVKCLRCNGLFQERLNQLREDQDHLPLKKGDWICEKCNFLNFAKNTICHQCKEKPPKRHLNPGEWECESCNYINFRRNMVCLKCDHRRPKASNASKASVQHEHEHGNVGHSSCSSRGFHHENEANGYAFLGLDGTNVGKGAYPRRFVEEERESNQSIAWNEDSRFVDFPIAGGKSSLSQNVQGIERWKLEMLERKGARIKENDEDDGYANNTQKQKFFDSSDDEEMADWFGHEKKMQLKNFCD
uniref:Uncharacterized protein LOC105123766 isoform X1 n=1 Tax=Rhizophora mucronata TaxID=61149 RepID=A0A2P2IX14_RHIMU